MNTMTATALEAARDYGAWLAIGVTAVVVLVIFAAMVGFWLLTSRFLAKTARWPELAKLYPAGTSPSGPAFGRQAGALHGVNYQGTLRVTPSPLGLFIEVERAFSYRHPPLFIPWSAFRELREYRSVLGARHYELVLTEDELFYLWDAAGEAVRRHFDGPHRTVPGRTLWPLFSRPLSFRWRV